MLPKSLQETRITIMPKKNKEWNKTKHYHQQRKITGTYIYLINIDAKDLNNIFTKRAGHGSIHLYSEHSCRQISVSSSSPWSTKWVQRHLGQLHREILSLKTYIWLSENIFMSIPEIQGCFNISKFKVW